MAFGRAEEADSRIIGCGNKEEQERWLSGLKQRTCSRRQDAGANIGEADGPKGEAQDVPSQSGVPPLIYWMVK